MAGRLLLLGHHHVGQSLLWFGDDTATVIVVVKVRGCQP